ncbi:hypothetical protein NMYAN_80107 [Nitrosomonas nitrosa]|uniref:Uncharacterized protein n=1 Tax=Nitrosomonas nitrosa TaxID=52442 RepID=A0A8H9DAK9_9PROT|nr:hypothetical protein NMYAN_80107 [Nitrosomonas nitrosa]
MHDDLPTIPLNCHTGIKGVYDQEAY